MVEIAHLIESEGAVLFSSFISDLTESPHIFVTLKINKDEISLILSAFERRGYTIESMHNTTRFESELKDRCDMLLHYPNM